MRRRQPRSALHQLHRLRYRMSHSDTQAQEESIEGQRFRQVRDILLRALAMNPKNAGCSPCSCPAVLRSPSTQPIDRTEQHPHTTARLQAHDFSETVLAGHNGCGRKYRVRKEMDMKEITKLKLHATDCPAGHERSLPRTDKQPANQKT